jgi:hypothetical protein
LRSTVVIFVLVFSVLGLLLGFTSNAGPRVIFESIGHYDYDLDTSDISEKEAENLVRMKSGQNNGLLYLRAIFPSNSTVLLETITEDPSDQRLILLVAGQEIIDGCSRTIRFLKLWENNTAVIVYPDEDFRFGCDEPAFRLVSER